MSISQTYGVMQHQVADELGDRTDLLTALSDSTLTLSPVQNAIQSAIAMWERERFYFNEILTDFNASGSPTSPWITVAGQEYYGASDYAGIATIAKFDKLWLLISSNRYTLTPRTSEELFDISVNPATRSNPTDYSFAAQQVKLYPPPDGAYPIGFLGTKRLAALSLTSDANAWTQDAYDLIRSTAKLILCEEVIHDAAMAAECKNSIYGDPGNPKRRGYLDALKRETQRRKTPGRIRPTAF